MAILTNKLYRYIVPNVAFVLIFLASASVTATASAVGSCNDFKFIMKTGGPHCSKRQKAEAFAWDNSLNTVFKYRLRSRSKSARVHSQNGLEVHAFGAIYRQRGTLEVFSRDGDPAVYLSAGGPFENIHFECLGNYCYANVEINPGHLSIRIGGVSHGPTMELERPAEFLSRLEGKKRMAIEMSLQSPYDKTTFYFNISDYKDITLDQ